MCGNNNYNPAEGMSNGYAAAPPSSLNSMQVNMMGATGLNPMGQAAQLPMNQGQGTRAFGM